MNIVFVDFIFVVVVEFLLLFFYEGGFCFCHANDNPLAGLNLSFEYFVVHLVFEP